MRTKKVIPSHVPNKGRTQKADRSDTFRGMGCITVPPTAKSYRKPRTDTSIDVFPTINSKPKYLIRELKRKGILS